LSIVIDASVALAWVLTDEANAEVLALLEDYGSARWHAPSHWPVEVANGLLMAERRRRIDLARVSASIAKLSALEVALDDDGAASAFTRVLPLARVHGLTLYDALYLELAERLGFPLATLDQELRDAAKTIGVELLP
jgi:predicted nucleic acid-binding protein